MIKVVSRSLRMLVSDNSTEFGARLRQAGERAGLFCINVKAIDEMVELLSVNRFDIICLQIGNPDIEGLEGLYALRAGPHPGCVLMFNFSSELYTRAAMQISRAHKLVLENHPWPLSDTVLDRIISDTISRLLHQGSKDDIME